MGTHIEWTTETWNPLVGCTPVSEGCRNCYAARHARRLAGHPNEEISRVYDGVAELRRHRRGHLVGQALAEQLARREHLVGPGAAEVVRHVGVLGEGDDSHLVAHLAGRERDGCVFFF